VEFSKKGGGKKEKFLRVALETPFCLQSKGKTQQVKKRKKEKKKLMRRSIPISGLRSHTHKVKKRERAGKKKRE